MNKQPVWRTGCGEALLVLLGLRMSEADDGSVSDGFRRDIAVRGSDSPKECLQRLWGPKVTRTNL